MKEAFSSQYNSVKLSVQDNNISGYSFRCNLGFKVTKKCDCDNFCNLSMKLKKTLETLNVRALWQNISKEVKIWSENIM